MLVTSQVLKKKKEKKKEEVGGVEKAKYPTKEAAGKLIVFLISKNTIKSQMLPLGGRLFAFFFSWGPFWPLSNDSFILIPTRGAEREK